MLTILYSSHYPQNINTEFLNQYFLIYINHKYKKIYNDINIEYHQTIYDDKKDIIQNGFCALETLNKLKSSINDCFLMYIANGHISHKQVKYDNVDILLFKNDSIDIKYTINTNICDILENDDKLVKLYKIKIFRSTLDDLFDKKYNILHI